MWNSGSLWGEIEFTPILKFNLWKSSNDHWITNDMEVNMLGEFFKGIYLSFKETLVERRSIKGLIYHFFYRLRWNLRPFFRNAGSIPLDVDVELANACNFRCTMCQQSTEWLKKADEKLMSWETLKNAVTQCKQLGVPSMKVNWRGESMLDPEFVEKIKYIKMMGIHEVQMNTNASKLTTELADQIIKSGLDRIIFSCDGISKETYNKIRRGGDWDRFHANVTMFKQRRDAIDATRKKNKGLPRIRINTSIQEANKHEISQVHYVFRNLADEVRFNTVYNPQQSNKLLGDERRQVKRKGCPQIYQRLIISANGDVVPCCVDFLEKLKLGNVNKVHLKEIYNKRVGRIRKKHENHEGRTLPSCDKCDNFALSFKGPNGKIGWQ